MMTGMAHFIAIYAIMKFHVVTRCGVTPEQLAQGHWTFHWCPVILTLFPETLIMKAHELAAKLLNGPNLDVMFQEHSGCLLEVSSSSSRPINECDEEMCGDAEGRLGEEIVVLYAY
jgi:hypothetical protein